MRIVYIVGIVGLCSASIGFALVDLTIYSAMLCSILAYITLMLYVNTSMAGIR